MMDQPSQGVSMEKEAGEMGLWQDTKRRFTELFQILGLRFTLMIVIIEHILQGFVFGGGTGGLIGTPIVYLMRSYGTLTASRIQILRTVAVSPWALKPLFGIISDTISIGGFNKLPYIMITLISAAIACLCIAFIQPLSPISITILQFLCFLQIAVADLLIEACYPKKINAKEKEKEEAEEEKREEEEEGIGPDLVSFIGIGVGFCQVFSIILTGIILTYCAIEYLHYIYLIPVPFFLATLYPVYWNWLDEKESEPEDEIPHVNLFYRFLLYQKKSSNPGGSMMTVTMKKKKGNPKKKWLPLVDMNIEKVKMNKNIFILSLIITTLSLTSSIIGLLDLPSLVLFVFSLMSSGVMIFSFFVLCERNIAKIQTYVILQNTFSISLDSAAFFFYTDDSSQFPEGPHFSNFFYVTWMGLIAVGFYIFSQSIYSLFLTRCKYRHILLIANLLSILVSIPTIFFYLRWNLKWGIPDSLFVIGSEMLSVITATWTYAPLSLLMYQLCPEGLEATVFALLAGSSNLGSSLSQYQGAYVLDLFGVKPIGAKGESVQFENLWIVQTIAIILPLIPILTIPFLIPDATQRDHKIDIPEILPVLKEEVLIFNSSSTESCEESDKQT